MLEDRSPEFQAFMVGVHERADWLAAQSRSVEGIRQVMDDFIGVLPLPDGVTVEPVDCDGVSAEWVDAPISISARVVLYIHGGCFISGSPGVVRECCARLAIAAESRVLSIDYRLAPEHPFPAALDDATTCYRWLLDSGYQPDNIVIVGESAGGGLTFSTLLKCRELSLPMPAGGVPISPWVDMEVQFGDSLSRNEGIDMAPVEPLRIGAAAYAVDEDRCHPLLSPLYADLSGLPPLLIQVGTSEVLLDEGVEIAKRAHAAGCDVTLEEWEDMIHVWHWYAVAYPEAQQAIDAMGRWIIEHTQAESH